MIDDICETLAIHFPFDAKKVKDVYVYCGSWDQTIRFLHAAVATAADPLFLARALPAAPGVMERLDE